VGDASRVFDDAVTIMNGVSVTTGSNSSDVDMTRRTGAHVTVEADFPGSPVDDLTVQLQGSLDGSNYDDVPVSEFDIDNATDPSQISLIVEKLAHFRIRCFRTGSTDTITVTIKHMLWG